MNEDEIKNNETDVIEKKEKTFTRDELNKIVATEKNKAREELKKELEAQKTEAERLAKLSSEERYKEEIEKANKIANDAVSRLNAYELKEQTLKDNTDIPIELINLIDFKICNTAELVKAKLDTIKTVYNKAVEIGVNETFKEKTPKTVVNNNTTEKKNVSRISI